MHFRRVWLGFAGAAAIGLAAPVNAQDSAGGLSLGEVVGAENQGTAIALRVLDEERLFRESAFGQRVQAELAEASRVLEDENQRLFDELSNDEEALTEARAEMRPDEFRAAANAFDLRAETIRREQAAKRQRLVQYEESEQRRFFSMAGPALGQVLRDSGAQVLIDARAVLLALPGVDLTDEGIEALDAEIGDGGPPPFPLVSDGTLRVLPQPTEQQNALPDNGLDLFPSDP